MSREMKLGMLLLACGVCWGAGAVEPAQKRILDSPFPQVAKIAEGISWPKGQALPIFATPAAELDCIEVQALTSDERITFSALQGQVNRQQPRIYLLDARSDEGRDTWANTATIGFKSRTLCTRETKFDLVRRSASESAWSADPSTGKPWLCSQGINSPMPGPWYS